MKITYCNLLNNVYVFFVQIQKIKKTEKNDGTYKDMKDHLKN